MANPISRTAYYTLGVRAADAASDNPVCNDAFAQRFMNDEARRVWEEFKDLRPPNLSNAARHAMIDEHLRRELAQNPAASVVIIGAGFDTRAYRLKGGRWFEFDEPEILTYKERRLPASTAPNPLVRIPVDFSSESLADKLAIVGTPLHAHVVIEGVLFYLTMAQRQALLDALAARFRNHTVYCDLMRKDFFESYGRKVHLKIRGIGATFTEMVQEPERLFLDAGYTAASLDSVFSYGVAKKSIGIPLFAVRWFLTTLRDGYRIGVFKRMA